MSTETLPIQSKTNVPLYQQIADELRTKILDQEYKSSSKLPSVAKLVKAYGVNARTVCQAYHILAKQGMVETVSGKGTFVLEPEKRRKKISLLLLKETESAVRRPDDYLYRLYHGILDEVSRLGIECEVKRFDVCEVGSLDFSGIDGVVLAASSRESMTCMRYLRGQDVDVVAVSQDQELPQENMLVVHGDDSQGMKLALDHLYQLGHRKIAMLNAPLSNFTAQVRLEEFTAFMRDKGLAIDPSWVCNTRYWDYDSYEDFEPEVRMLWESSNRPTAIISSRGLLAMGLLALLAREGIRVPEEISVCGYDDQPAFSFTYPSLTTIDQPIEEYGKAAVKILVDKIDGKEVESKVFPVRLIRRQSTGPAHDGAA